MTYNVTRWGDSHKKLAKKYLERHRKLNPLPTDIMDWIKIARPKVENIEREFLTCPFWIPIYNDDHNYQMIMGGRQIYKSTACTDFIAHTATTQPGVQVCYVTYDQESLSSFSKQKLKIGTFLANKTLAKYLRHPGNIGEVSLKNNSTVYLVTDNYQYRHLEGKSPTLCIIDEAQYQDIEYFGRVHQTMMATKGKVKIFGIGGEAGSAYEKLWKETNQMEWYYDNPDWRERLQYDHNGLIIGLYLREVLKGRWIPQNPSVTSFQGYHIPQTMLATIPLTIQDAVEKYKIHPRFSIEGQKKILKGSEFDSHVMGGFYNSPHRPITKEMMDNCTKHYRYLSMLRDDEVRNLKKIFGNEITIAMGVDFGSGSSSVTAISIIILWRKSKRIQVAFIEKRPQENQLKQAQYIAELFESYSCDIGVGDLGYGANQIKIIQDGGHAIDTGELFEGVTDSKFFGCRSISDNTKPIQIFEQTTDEHGDQVGRVQIDKTSSIEYLIECMENVVYHPIFSSEKTRSRAKLIIPSKNDYEIDFLLEELSNITRKDLQNFERIISDPRQVPRKEYNHPPDSAMSLIYGIVALKVKEQTKWHWISA
ncbi:hypothetical protein BD31_I1093 [Candidatus Nitrosopumilus salaria BD31]|uniref:Phage terminase, large subunit, PBSX family n=1 Tax=Candidatus Nitrosopumilus salarius BD31 TaxID=859350 RepID=I3D4N2_9ARCH|nr:hypothetical protein [Candidatus Nitrosopumilus salaria]EIJ66675.1 hypothetical protein BD31_I1093 [Candidatus Nitrosopumilus salaria BD31]